MSGEAPQLALNESDNEEEEVQTVQSKWLNDDGCHVMRNSHKGTYSPKRLQIELNMKPGRWATIGSYQPLAWLAVCTTLH